MAVNRFIARTGKRIEREPSTGIAIIAILAFIAICVFVAIVEHS